MPRHLLGVMFLVASLVPPAQAAPGDEEAPFGLTWGPMSQVPRPSEIDREANVTALTYLAGHPPAIGSSTGKVVLEVCREEGLQRIVWFSRVLTASQLQSVYTGIYQEGVRLYGVPVAGTRSFSVTWPTARTVLTVHAVPGGGEQIIMAADGRDYAICSQRHRDETGHTADSHTAELLHEQVR
ncbi:threonyl-trna synthetase [Methylobacterium variabile]|nr:threonyl-trna synthetase [Methylobacterium variabile]